MLPENCGLGAHGFGCRINEPKIAIVFGGFNIFNNLVYSNHIDIEIVTEKLNSGFQIFRWRLQIVFVVENKPVRKRRIDPFFDEAIDVWVHSFNKCSKPIWRISLSVF